MAWLASLSVWHLHWPMFLPVCMRRTIHFRNEDQFHISVVHIAILTALDGVWIIVGHRLLFHACIEPEHSLLSTSKADFPLAMASSWSVGGYLDLRTWTTEQRQPHPLGG